MSWKERVGLMARSKKWFMKFSDVKKVDIAPFNPNHVVLAEAYIRKLQKTIGGNVEIEHRGATALGISGKGEIDLDVRAPSNRFDSILKKMMDHHFPEQGKIEHNRVRFNDKYRGIIIEIQLVRKGSVIDRDDTTVFNYLNDHPRTLKQYEKLKIKYSNTSKREYYVQKDKFYRRIIKKAKKK